MEESNQKIYSNKSAKSNAANLIYHDYGGLADEVDDIQEIVTFNGKDGSEIERTKSILANRQAKTKAREERRIALFLESYRILSEEKRKEVAQYQKSAEQIISDYLKEEKEIEGLSEEERFILNKIKNEYREFKKNKKQGAFSFDLASETDKLIYSNLIYDICFRLAGLESPTKRIKQSPEELKDQISSKKQDKFLPIEIKLKNKSDPKTDLSAKFLTIEYLKKKENVLNEDLAREIISIARDWFYYGGDFYKHWTGRALKIKEGIDYELNPDGSVDEATITSIKNKIAEDWLKQSINKNWIAEANEFKRINEKDISYKKEKLQVKDDKGRVRELEKYTTPYFCEMGWLIYESNYFDLVNSAMTQRQREPSKYRIYFNLENQDIIRVYSELISKLRADEELEKYGFSINTIAIFDPTVEVITEAINQKDKIILFVGEKGINRALALLQEYVQKNKAKFNKKGILLAQPFFDRDGKEIPGISISSDTKGVSPDSSRGFPKYKSFNYMQSEIIQSTLDSIFKEIYNFDNLDKIGMINPQLRDILLEIGHDGKLKDYLAMFLSQKSGVSFLIKNLIRFYPKWSKAFGMSSKNIAFREEEK